MPLLGWAGNDLPPLYPGKKLQAQPAQRSGEGPIPHSLLALVDMTSSNNNSGRTPTRLMLLRPPPLRLSFEASFFPAHSGSHLRVSGS